MGIAKRITTWALCLVLAMGLLPAASLTAHAATGAGTESDPLYVTTFAELKAALEEENDTYIVVNEFVTDTSVLDTRYYNLNDDFVDNGPAIVIPMDVKKTLVLNTDIDCRPSTTTKQLAYFIYNRGDLTIKGNGTLNCGFNSMANTLENYAPSTIIYNTNAGKLTIQDNPTLTTEKSNFTGARSAIWNFGTATIEGGTFADYCDLTGEVGAVANCDVMTVLNSKDGHLIVRGGTFKAKSTQSATDFYCAGLYSDNVNVELYGGTFEGIASNTDPDHDGVDEPISKFLADGYKYVRTNDNTDFNASAVTYTTANLKVVSENPAYTVKFDANGGSGTMADATDISGEYALPACGFTAPANKLFKAWSVNGVEKAVGEKITVSANTTVTAIWEDKTFAITVNGDGNPKAYYLGAEITEQEAGNLVLLSAAATYEGQEFDKWISDDVEITDAGKYDGAKFTMPTKNVTVTATYKNDPAVTGYTLSFAAEEGGSGTMEPLTGGTTYTLPECGFTAPEGKEFAGWNVFEELQAAGATVTITSDRTAVAMWKDKADGGETSTEYDITVIGGTASANKAVAGSEITLTVDESAVPAGKVFDEWEVASGDVTIADGKFTMPESNVVIKAAYKDASVQPGEGEEDGNEPSSGNEGDEPKKPEPNDGGKEDVIAKTELPPISWTTRSGRFSLWDLNRWPEMT